MMQWHPSLPLWLCYCGLVGNDTDVEEGKQWRMQRKETLRRILGDPRISMHFPRFFYLIAHHHYSSSYYYYSIIKLSSSHHSHILIISLQILLSTLMWWLAHTSVLKEIVWWICTYNGSEGYTGWAWRLQRRSTVIDSCSPRCHCSAWRRII